MKFGVVYSSHWWVLGCEARVLLSLTGIAWISTVFAVTRTAKSTKVLMVI